ncbi:hypothetical protein J572_2800 [Acinetobacter baumannii 1499986]|uniref:Uncharacterized protein n=1 Tax=Acinetobacter baumannii 1499986 TaxID=1310673 RepID=A0A836M097_ACIBA|nr:hypothetical protein J585_1705 [Acinetobacter baumannii 397971]KCY00692.1 hypothetical protein J572_2800 [Acinetobacter baumannii 1499986]
MLSIHLIPSYFHHQLQLWFLHPVLNFQGALQRLPMHVISLV